MWREHDSVYKCQNPGSNSDSHRCDLGKARRCHWGWIFIWWEKSSNFYKYIYMKNTEKLIHWPQGRHALDMWPRGRHGWVSCLLTPSPPGCCCPGGPHWTRPRAGSSPPPRVRCLPWWGLTTRRRPQKNPSCQFHPSTKQSFPSTPRDHLLVGDSLSLSQATLLHPQMILTPASMVTRLPGVSPCIMETLTTYQLLITLIMPLWHLISLHTLHLTHLQQLTIIKPLPPLLLQCDMQAQFTLTGDLASSNSFSKFTRHSCISAGNG